MYHIHAPGHEEEDVQPLDAKVFPYICMMLEYVVVLKWRIVHVNTLPQHWLQFKYPSLNRLADAVKEVVDTLRLGL